MLYASLVFIGGLKRRDFGRILLLLHLKLNFSCSLAVAKFSCALHSYLLSWYASNPRFRIEENEGQSGVFIFEDNKISSDLCSTKPSFRPSKRKSFSRREAIRAVYILSKAQVYRLQQLKKYKWNNNENITFF